MVVGVEAVGGEVEDSAAPPEDGATAGVVVVEVDRVAGVVDDGDTAGAPFVPFAVTEAPGCSLATTTPMTTVAPVATSAADRDNRRSRACARFRARAE